ncbi:MAG TPA: DUF84 family protein [Candidatus Paceibacterota bacterium]
MKILLGTTSDSKINIVKTFFQDKGGVEIISCDVSSGITDQPLDLEITIRGATNRAKNALSLNNHNDDIGLIALGLEGGLVLEKDRVYALVCVAVLLKPSGETYIGTSSPISLPEEVSNRIAKGEQFGEVIREFEGNLANETDQHFRDKINELIGRKGSFLEAVKSVFKEVSVSK